MGYRPPDNSQMQLKTEDHHGSDVVAIRCLGCSAFRLKWVTDSQYTRLLSPIGAHSFVARLGSFRSPSCLCDLNFSPHIRIAADASQARRLPNTNNGEDANRGGQRAAGGERTRPK
jgi:hypothetical protein